MPVAKPLLKPLPKLPVPAFCSGATYTGGGDQAPDVTIHGAVWAARDFDIEIQLVGMPQTIEAELRKHDTSGLRLPIIPASEVIDISSEYSSTEFGAPQALGEPDAIGVGTKRSNAWLAGNVSKKEFIVVAIDQPIKANQLIVAEAEHPGAIKSIFLYDEGYYEYTHLNLNPGRVEDEARFFHQRFEETPFVVHAVKLALKGFPISCFGFIKHFTAPVVEYYW